MSVPVSEVVDEAIRYEHNVAALYHAFNSIFSDDAELWWKLSLSEEEHAVLLESSRALFRDEYARDTVPADLAALRQSNESLEAQLDKVPNDPPTREGAFLIALDLERNANELTLHRLLTIERSQPANDVVARIQDDEASHVQMIRGYADRHGISI